MTVHVGNWLFFSNIDGYLLGWQSETCSACVADGNDDDNGENQSGV